MMEEGEIENTLMFPIPLDNRLSHRHHCPPHRCNRPYWSLRWSVPFHCRRPYRCLRMIFPRTRLAVRWSKNELDVTSIPPDLYCRIQHRFCSIGDNNFHTMTPFHFQRWFSEVVPQIYLKFPADNFVRLQTDFTLFS